MKSIYLQKDKATFDLSHYPAEEFAASLGLPGAPQIKFGGQQVKEKKRGGAEQARVVVQEAPASRDVVASDDEDDDEVSDAETGGEDVEERQLDISGEEEESEGGDSASGSESESGSNAPATVSTIFTLCNTAAPD